MLGLHVGILDRDPTPEDREAERDDPRPGVWAGERFADGRRLTQDQTDALIRSELFMRCSIAELDDIVMAVGQPVFFAFMVDGWQRPARVQRGGIDSDPLVRVLARRAWGDRDRRWEIAP